MTASLSTVHFTSNLYRALSLKAYRAEIERLTEFLNAEPENAAARHNRGVAHYHLGAHDEALRDFAAASELAPESPAPYLLAAEIYRQQEARETEIAVLTRALEQLADRYYRWQALCARARAQAARGRLEAALADYETAAQTVPTFRKTYLERGALLYRAGRRQRGLADLKRATINSNSESLDWGPVADIVMAEPELQRSGCLNEIFEARRIVAAAGRPVDAEDFDRATLESAAAEHRLIVVWVYRSMGDGQAMYKCAAPEDLRHRPEGLLLFPRPIPERLRELSHPDLEEGFEVVNLFRECADWCGHPIAEETAS